MVVLERRQWSDSETPAELALTLDPIVKSFFMTKSPPQATV